MPSHTTKCLKKKSKKINRSVFPFHAEIANESLFLPLT